MTCRQAKRLFGSYWDDETTQAEREVLESHFGGCAVCRAEYETYARALEMLATMPRVEPAPDLAERALARARKASTAPDRIPTPARQWAPVTAAAAIVLLLATLISPWIGPGTRLLDNASWNRSGTPESATDPTAPELTAPVAVEVPETSATSTDEAEPIAAMSDSLFDHSEDVEFILDPVTVRRGRPSMTRPRSQVQGEHAVISF